MGSPYFITDGRKFSVFICFRKHEKLFIIVWKKKHTVIFQVSAVACTVTEPLPACLGSDGSRGAAQLLCLFRDDGVHIRAAGGCRRMLSGAFPLGRGPQASRSCTLCLTDHPCSCCVVYIVLLRHVCIVYVF